MNDKIALITGGSRGLGRSTAIHLAGNGIGVVLTYHSRKAEAEVVVAEIEKMGGRAAALQLDTGETSQFPAFAEELAGVLERVWGRRTFSFLVNNAGNGVYKSFEETTEAELDSLVAVHLKGAFFLTQRLVPLIEDGGGIVNVSSGLARFALPGSPPTAA